MNKTILTIVMATLCLNFSAKAQEPGKPPPLKNQGLIGKVISASTGESLPGAVIKVTPTKQTLVSNDRGEFILSLVNGTYDLSVHYLNYKTKNIMIQIPLNEKLIVELEANEQDLQEIEIVSTGYQNIPKERATGNFVQVNNETLNRRVSNNILEKLEGITSGLVFNKNVNISNNSNPSTLTIGGRTTILANPNPLIIVDNFPYDGDINMINPNDVENITVLKDAAASSIWGAFSGNGVVVITTKKGRYNHASKISLNTNLTVGERPNLKYTPQINSVHVVELQHYLYEKGYYNSKISSSSHPSLPPLIDILVNRKNNLISRADSVNQINELMNIDTRDDMQEYLFRKSVNQQYSLNINGGGNNNQYYFGLGYDKNINNSVRNDFGRLTLNANNTYAFFNRKVEFNTVIGFTRNKTATNGISSLPQYYPYLKLADESGNPLISPNVYRQSYIDTVGRGNLLDWNYRPLDALANNDNTAQQTEYRLGANLKYNVFSGFVISAQYQYSNDNSRRRIYYSQDSYTTRDLINSFTQLDGKRPIPLGGVLDNSVANHTAQNFRAQADYSHRWNQLNELTALVGYEVRDFNSNNSINRLYGYNDNLRTSSNVDYVTIFSKVYGRKTTGTIVANDSELGKINRFTSYFANAAYSFDQRYTISASARKDASNLFGVKANQRGVPLWSVGASWLISEERFYNNTFVPYLRLRVTNGYNGNIDRTVSALITAIVSPSSNVYSKPYSTVSNAPNDNLRWEKINTTNFGADFHISNVLTGSLEYYIKKGRDIIGASSIDPTTGLISFKGNSANIFVNGCDITLNSVNVDQKFKWNTTFLFSYAKDKVTKYLLKPVSINEPLSGGLSPIEGNPVYSLYSLKWAGLDSLGRPGVFYNGQVSNEYSEIYNSTDLGSLVYQGPKNPTIFGSIRNDFDLKQFHLSLNIVYKFNYYFRRSSLLGSEAFAGSIFSPDADYLNRWQNKGDELKTNVPALTYPANSTRDAMYKYADILTEKGDHIRFQDIQVAYRFNTKKLSKFNLNNLEIYGYVNNLGVLWSATKTNLDPDYVPNGSLIYPNPRTYSIGLRASF